MILICGIPSEGPVALVIAAAAEAGIHCVVLNQRQVEEWSLELGLEGERLGGCLRGPDGEWGLDAFAGVYARPVAARELPEVGDPADPAKLARAEALERSLVTWLEVAPCRVVNRLGPSASNASKPYQAQRVLESGLDVPPTTITNDPDEVRRFVAQHGRVIFKSISSTRSIVRELSGPRVRGLERVRHLPTQFQALVPGADVRVHVIGSTVHATEVSSTAIDYRYADGEGVEVGMAPCDLPDEVESACLALSRALELPFCGIDLRRGEGGRWYCFEVNPSPAFSYYEGQTGQPIGRALVEYLAGVGAKEESDGGGAD